MSSRSKRGGRGPGAARSRPSHKDPVPQPEDKEVEEIRAQADEAVRLLSFVKGQFPHMVAAVPRGQMVEYLRHGSRRTYARYFKGFRPDRIPLARLVGYLSEEVFDNNNGVLAHLIIVLWNEQRRDLYEATKKGLQTINPNVELIERVPPELSRSLLGELIGTFGKQDVAILCQINDARFDRAVIRELLPEWEWPELREGITEKDQEKLAEVLESRGEDPALAAGLPLRQEGGAEAPEEGGQAADDPAASEDATAEPAAGEEATVTPAADDGPAA